jgi:hypothetical protein
MKKASNLLASAIVAAAIFFGSSAKAQTTTTAPSPWRLGFGIEGGIPTGSIHDFSKFELGGTARLQYDLSSNSDLTLTSGYYSFIAHPDGFKAQGVVPVKVGIKYFFTQNVYVAGEAGAGLETNYAKNTKLLLSPGLGWANDHWDVGVRYESLSGQNNSYGTVALRLAYGFRL